ncbi:protein trapped in endoderm-1-like [Haliotis rubra]|uniref:protein trapped in endoderm-1-like n=1 Tax=Haliotis rubra TaxID=36100 RepID=UPI001EE5F0B9|nr:protein trapped in endoderm-1-like [Haliotis rubra]
MAVSVNSTLTYEGLSNGLHIFHSVCSITIAVAGTVGNSFSIYRLTQKGQKQQTCNIYLANLSVNNLLSSGIILPLIAINSFFKGWIYGTAFCKLFAYFLYSNICAEANAFVLLTVNRFMKIVHPKTYNTVYGRTRNNAIIIGAGWLMYAIVFILPLTDALGQFAFDPNKNFCGIINKDKFASVVAMCILSTSLPVIVVSYVSIFRTYKKSKQKIADKKDVEQTNTGIHSKQEVRLLRMIIIILVCFVLTYTPFAVMTIVDPSMELAGQWIHTIMSYITWTHLFINPIIYIIKSPKK